MVEGKLCDYINQHMDDLVETYMEHLRNIGNGYQRCERDLLMAMARYDFELLIQALEARDMTVFVDSVRKSAPDLPNVTSEARLQALVTLEGLLLPLAEDGDTVQLLCQTLNAAKGTMVEMVTQTLHALEQEKQALKEEQAFLRQVIDVNPNFIFVRDSEGRFVLGNQAVAEAYGTTTEALVGQTDAELRARLQGAGRQQSVKHLRRDDVHIMTSGQEKFIFEQRITDADGKHRWLQTIKRPFLDDEGRIQYVFGVSSDITQRKELEQEIQESLARRAQEVQTSTEVAQEIADAPALDEVFERIVTLIKERFDYYHAQIFRYDPGRDAMVLFIGYGDAGEKMLAAGHHLQSGRGVVGTAAVTRRPVLATDVTQDPDWLPNPFLPDTQGELAVPIIIRHGADEAEVLGILDVQSDVAGALTEEDQLLLEGLCGQIAIAIDATRLRQKLEAQLEALNACVE